MTPFRAQIPVESEVPQQVGLPPVIVNNLPSPPSDAFLTQPWATFAAGVLAIIAACIAFGGVVYTQRRTARSTRAQMRLQSMFAIRQQRQHEAQLDATAELERSKHLRQVSHETLMAVLLAVVDARDSAISRQMMLDRDGPDLDDSGDPEYTIVSENWVKTMRTVDAVKEKAILLYPIGHDDAHEKVMEFSEICTTWLMTGVRDPIGRINETSALAIAAIRDAYNA